MGAILARCRIGYQIAMLGMAGVLGMVLVAGIDWWGTNQIAFSDTRVATAQQAGDIESHIQMAFLQLRRHEKDFLLRRNERYVTAHAAAVLDVDKAVAELKTLVADQPSVLDQLTRVGVDAGRYAVAFGAVVSSARLVGLHEDDGLLGALRKSVHEIETILRTIDVPKAQIAMLMMRRHEKDFIARLDPKYGNDIKARLPEFIAALDTAGIDPATRAPIMARMTAYQDMFARMMAGTLAEQAAVRALSAIFADIEPRLIAMNAEFAAQARAAELEGAALAAAYHRIVMTTIVGIVVVVGILCTLIGRGIARPLIAITRAMEGLVGGNLDTPIPPGARRDEIGTLIKAVHAFKASLIVAADLRNQQAAERDRAETEKRDSLFRMAERIETESASSVEQIIERTMTMTGTAEEMRALAERAGNSAQGAAGAASMALGNAQTVAAAAEELAASIREISAQVNQSTQVVNAAVAAGTETRATIVTLNERVGRIGAVVDIIGDIASKTNLLALNATIEAARAGEAGKGFAVVAGEVKQLANQTARSTEEITRHIADVRAATQAAVTAVTRIETTISQVNEIAGSIAAAVEQQGSATAEIARNVTETASAVHEMSARNAEVSQEAKQAGLHADDVLASTKVLTDAIDGLKHAMVRTVRTSTAEVDRRMFKRYSLDQSGRVDLAGQGIHDARIADISAGGARLNDLPTVTVGQRGRLMLGGVSTPLAFKVLGVTPDGARIAFEADETCQQALRSFLGTMTADAAA